VFKIENLVQGKWQKVCEVETRRKALRELHQRARRDNSTRWRAVDAQTRTSYMLPERYYSGE